MAFRLCELDEVRPLPAQTRDCLGDARPERPVRMSVKKLDPADPSGLDRGDISSESFLRCIPTDNMKPRLRRAIIRPRDSCANHRTHACKSPKYPNHFPHSSKLLSVAYYSKTIRQNEYSPSPV